MPLVPGRALVLALLLPLVLGAAAVLDPPLVTSMIALDAGIIAVAVVDAAMTSRKGIAVSRHAPDSASLARPFNVELELKSSARRRLRVRVNDSPPLTCTQEGLPTEVDLEPNTVRRAEYRLWPMQRGPAEFGECWVRYPSLLGFWQVQLRCRVETTVRVFPDVQAVRHWELLARTGQNRMASRLTRHRGGDTEFERLRDHQRDDEFRRIDWRATARRRRLTVREYQLERNQNLVILLDCGRTMGGEWSGVTALDHALNATLMLTHVAVRRGDRVGFIAFGERIERYISPRAGLSASNHIIQATYDLFPSVVEPDYDEAFKLLKQRVRQRTLAILITHALDQPTADRLKAVTRELLPRHLPLVVLLRDADLEARTHQVAVDDESLGVQAAAAELLLWRDKLTLELERAGVLVLDVLHRNLTGALLAQYLEVKARGLI